jgi:hypothetical protein
MLWFERFYGVGPFEISHKVGSLIYLKDIPDKHNGWHKERFEEFEECP